MSPRTLALAAGLLAVVSVGAASLATPPARSARPTLLAQRGGPMRCSGDPDCSRLRAPAPRPCPSGGQMIGTACCRMGYCGICWSDCPPASH